MNKETKETSTVSKSEINGVTLTEYQMYRFAVLLYGKSEMISTSDKAASVLQEHGHSVKKLANI